MKNKLLKLLLVTVLSLALAFVTVACNETEKPQLPLAWDGTTVATDAQMEEAYDEDTQTYSISTASQLAWVSAQAEKVNNLSGKTIKLVEDINLGNKDFAPIGNVEAYPGKTFAGTFDGNGKTIYNLKVTDKATGSLYSTAALFGSIDNGTVKNLTVDGATIVSDHYAAVLVGYSSTNVTIENCVVKNANILSEVALFGNGYDNGDKVGGIIGYATNASITNCTVEKTAIKAYRHIGGIAGYVGGSTVTITDNTVKNVSVTQDFTNGYKTVSAVNELAQKFVGNLATVDSSNTATSVTVSQINKPLA